MAKDGEKFERPLTHNLLVNILETLGAKVERVVINDLIESTFYARIILNHGEKTYSIDARPSDSIAIALLSNAPIYASSHVLDQAGGILLGLGRGRRARGLGLISLIMYLPNDLEVLFTRLIPPVQGVVPLRVSFPFTEQGTNKSRTTFP